MAFTEARLSVLPEGLRPVEEVPPLVSPSLGFVLYPAAVPLEAPSDDPEAEEPEPRACAMANDRWGPVFAAVGGFACSDDGARWAYVARDPEFFEKEWLVVNHEKKLELGGGRPFVSPDGRAVACTQIVRDAKSGLPRVRVVVGEETGPFLASVAPAGFGAGGLFAYKAFDGESYAVIAGGEPQGPYVDVQELQWSPGGKRLAYIAGDPLSLDRYAVVDGKKGPVWANARAIRFSADGARVAYIAAAEGGERIVVDGVTGPAFTRCSQPEFSADGRTVVSRVGMGEEWAIAVDGRAGAAYDEVGPPVCSRDGATVAYGAKRGDRSFVVVGASESQPCDFVYRLVVGERAGVAFALQEGKSSVLIHNGREVRRGASRPTHLAISADGATLACSEGEGGKVRMVVGGEPGEEFTSVDRPFFAPDGRRVAYKARLGGEEFLVVGGRRHGPMALLTDPVFDAAGANVAVVARIGREIWRKVFPI